MGNRIFKIVYTIFMAVIMVAVVAFMILHIQAGISDVNSKLLLWGYIIILIWAAYRLYSLIKDLRKK